MEYETNEQMCIRDSVTIALRITVVLEKHPLWE